MGLCIYLQPRLRIIEEPTKSNVQGGHVMKTLISIIALIIITCTQAYAWKCTTHMLVAVESNNAGVQACAPDNKVNGKRSFDHWKNVPMNVTITQANFTTLPYDGQLYERLTELAHKHTLTTVEMEELVHAAGDISQPMHNAVYDSFNKVNHKAYDDMNVTSACLTQLPVPTDAIAYAVAIAEAAHTKAYEHEYTTQEACYAVSQSIALAKALTHHK
jgi:hypothetical protein